MSNTVQELIRSSLRLIQEMNPGQVQNSDDLTDALLNLNLMLESWGIDRNNIFEIARAEFTLVAGTASYTIGPSGDFSAVRPRRIERAGYLDANGYEYPIEIMLVDEWARLRIKSISSSIPDKLYNDGAHPNSTLYLYPVPSAANSLLLYTWQPLACCKFTAATDVVSMPPGYADAIRYNLAVRLAPEWNRVLRADVAELARHSLAEVQRLNLPAPEMRCDRAVLANRSPYWLPWQ